MTAWAFVRSIGLAVLFSPVLLGMVGVTLQLVKGQQSLTDTWKVLVGLPVIWAFALLIGGIPVFIGTGIAAAFLNFVARMIGSAVVTFGFVGLIALATIPIFLGRYPNGDGGTMQSLVEQVKAMLACSIAIWCALSLWQTRAAM